MCLLPNVAHAVVTERTTLGGSFEDIGGWSNGVPVVGDTAEFNIVSTYTVSVGQSHTSMDVDVLAGDVTLQSIGGPHLWTVDNRFDVIGARLTLDALDLDIGLVLDIRGAGSVDINSGSDVTIAIMRVGSNGGDGELNIDGSGSILSMTDAAQVFGVGGSGASGTVTFSNSAAGSIAGGLNLGISGVAGSTGLFNIQTGADVTVQGNINLGTSGLASQSGTLTINGAGSTLIQNGASTLTLGTASGSTAALTVINGGSFTGGAATVNATGSLIVGGGTFDAQSSLAVDGGALSIHNDGELITPSLSLTNGYTLNFNGGVIRVANGSFSSDVSVNFGSVLPGQQSTFEFLDGTDAVVPFAWRIGNDAGTTGDTVVDGVNGGVRSTLRNTGGGAGADLVVGGSGDGSLTVSNGGLADFNDDLVIGSSATGVGAMTVTGMQGGFRATASFMNGGSNIAVGNSGQGTLDVLDSGLVETLNDVNIAANPLSVGTVTVSGGGATPSELSVGDDLYIGGTESAAGGTGSLTIGNGGQVSVADTLHVYPDGALSVDGNIQTSSLQVDAGSTFSFTGAGQIHVAGGTAAFNNGTVAFGTTTPGGSADFLFDGGVTANVNGDWLITDVAGTSASTTVDGPGSSLNATEPDSQFMVGFYGDGILDVTDSGTVTSVDGHIAGVSGSTGVATVTGTGSSWTNTGELRVAGDGTLNVVAGGSVSNTLGAIGLTSGLTSVVTVTGAGSTWTNSQTLLIGTNGHGILNIEAGGTVSSYGATFGNSSSGTGVATVTGPGSTWINTNRIDLGRSGMGTLNIQNGGSVSSTGMYIERSSTVTVVGTGSTLTSGTIFVAGNGSGYLNVQDGGSVLNTEGIVGENLFSNGVATVSGAGSTWTNTGTLTVGKKNSSIGTLTVGAAGAVSNTEGHIGDEGGSTGTATVTGAGSTWTNSGILHVGNAGRGTLNVEAGGSVSNTAGTIAGLTGSTGTATVTGAGSTWINSGALDIGNAGNGTLSIEAGGLVSNTTSTIAEQAGSTGTATVTGAGSTWSTAGHLYLGGNAVSAGGGGTLDVLDSGHAEITGTFEIWNTGAATLDGGTLSVGSMDPTSVSNFDFVSGTFNLTSDNLNIGTGGLFGSELIITNSQTINITNLATIGTDGTLIIHPSGSFSSGGLTNLGTAVFIDTTIGGPVTNPTGSAIDVVGDVTFTGLVSGGGGIFGSGTADFQGGFSPGDSAALVTVEGSASFGASNTLFMEIGGLLAGSEYDVLDIAGNLNVGGTLDVSLINAFDPSAGDSFDILDFGSITGNFGTLNLPTLTGNLDWDTSSLLINGTLSVFSTSLQGDLDNDGFVGIADLNIVLGNWNLSVPPGDPLLGDPSGDGFVGIADLNVVLGNWNAGTPPSNNANIPEPASLACLGLGALSLMRRSQLMA